MATRPQHSKRDRGRAHVGLPPKQAVRRKCPDCGEWFWNRGAHYEACCGSLNAGVAQKPPTTQESGAAKVPGEGKSTAGTRRSRPGTPAPALREFTGWYGVSGLCSCGWRRDGGRCVHGNPYVPVFRVTRATEEG